MTNDRIIELAERANVALERSVDGIRCVNISTELENFAELLIRDCINECREVMYAAMEIELELGSDGIDFDRGRKSGKKFGSMECAARIVAKYGIRL